MSATVTGPMLARELALLGAEAALAEKDSDIIDPTVGFLHAPERFTALGDKMRAHTKNASVRKRLCTQLCLSIEGYWLIMLLAAAELYPEAAAALSFLAEDERVQLVTPVAYARLMQTALKFPYVQGLAEATAGCRAERLGLVERVSSAIFDLRPSTHQPLRLSQVEARLQMFGEAERNDTPDLRVSVEPQVTRLVFPESLVCASRDLLNKKRLLCVRSPAPRVGRQFGLDLAALGKQPTILVQGMDEQPPELQQVARLCGGLVVVDLFAACRTRSFPVSYAHGLASLRRLTVLLVPENAETGEWPTVDLEDLDFATRQRVFSMELGEGKTARSLAERFCLSTDELRAAVRAAASARKSGGASTAVPDAVAISHQILAQGARRMGRMVTQLEISAVFDDLVVPTTLRETLQDVAGYYRAAPRVLCDWRMAEKTRLGRGMSCLFSGNTGTGKTFAAQCLASELGLNLYRIDLSQVVSKYIGETEKALAQLFEEAEAGHGILLFDEADALFGKRSEVKDAHDRYANIEVAYLLQRMESFAGISILTTNLRGNIDSAFMRRIRFVAEFPMPDAVMRHRLWLASLPEQERWESGLELEPFVERFPLSGGSIHNIGITAAHLAAAEEAGLLCTTHLVRATYRELEKVGLARSRDDFGPLSSYLPRVRA